MSHGLGRFRRRLISLTVSAKPTTWTLNYPNQRDWTLAEIDVAFQMDGNFKQEPYNVWLDKVQLTRIELPDT